MANRLWWSGLIALAAAFVLPLVILPDRKWDRTVLWIDGALTVVALACLLLSLNLR